MINLYWWRPTADGSKINLGDEIGRIIVESLSGQEVKWAGLDQCDLISVGSILSFAVERNVFSARESPIHVWGTGVMSPTSRIPKEANYIYHAVRGPLTRCLIPGPENLPVGDPGLLVAEEFPSTAAKQYAWGIIPHHSQLDNQMIKDLASETPNSIIIDLTDPDIKGTLSRISACERIVSSSLHGIIFADSYNIPNCWIFIKSLHGGKSWKFFDYFASVGRMDFEPVPLPKSRNLDDIPSASIAYQHFPRLSSVCEKLAGRFPRSF